MQIRWPRKSGIPVDGSFIALEFCFADRLALRARDDEGFYGIAGARHLHETVKILLMGRGEFSK